MEEGKRGVNEREREGGRGEGGECESDTQREGCV